MIILAHRANLNGPHSVVENSLEACARALAQGFGLETDLRREGSGEFYISHDAQPLSPGNTLAAYSKIFAQYPEMELAINVKELGYEAALVELMNSGQLGKTSFYFDFELLEPKTPGAAQRKIKTLPQSETVRLASRLSDRNEPLAQCLAIPAEIVWGDEFDSLWLTETQINWVHATKRKIYMISPEIHGFGLDEMKQRWADFQAWNIDGICTDYPLAAREFFNGSAGAR